MPTFRSPVMAVAVALSAACHAPMTEDPVHPPVARRVRHENHWHGRVYVDDYHWLRDKQSPEVRAHLEAENAFTAARTAHLASFEQRLYEELVARVQQTDLSVPVRRGAFHYYTRTVEGQQYPIRCRRRARADGSDDEAAAEQVLLDQNALAVGHAFFGIGEVQISDDDRLCAYTTDTTGFRVYSLQVVDLDSGELRADLAERVTSVEWCADNATLFYVTEDPVTKRSNQLWRLRLGGEPQLVFEEGDELFRMAIGRSKDRRFLLAASMSTDTHEWRWLPAERPEDAFTVLLPREKGHRYAVEHRDGLFYLRTDRHALDFRVVTAPVDDPREVNWRELVPHRPGTLIAGFEVFRDFAVVRERVQGLERFRVHEFATGAWREIEFPEQVYSAQGGGNPEFTARSYRIDYQSMVTPPCVYDFDLATLERTLKKQQPVIGYDPAAYATERVWAPAADGARVPISVVYRRDLPRDGTAPLWLAGYGSYGITIPAGFNSDRISLLDRGVVFAIAHVRGGSMLGEAWRRGGMLMNKKNTFTDFIACAEHLARERWVSPARMMAEGGSAGGLLLGAVANMRPDLFCCMHSAVPFVDVVNTMMDASLPLTVGEYLEWGNPNEPEAFDYIVSYSPYDNLRAQAYPAILVTTSFNDSQVMYWEPAKYVARLRTLKTDDRELLLKCRLEAAGHGGASGRYDRWKERALEMAWMLSQVGITG